MSKHANAPDTLEDHGKPVLGSRETVTVTGQRDDARVEARIDSGAPRTHVDVGLACSVGAGPLVGEGTFRGSNGSADRLIVELEVEVRGTTHVVEASVADRSHLTTDVRLGRDILEGYLVDVSR